MIKVLIADDHAVVREGLKRIISETSDIVVADEAGSGQEVLEKVWKNNYDLVLLDISMPGRSGLEVLRQLRKEKPSLKILVLSIYSEEQYGIRVLRGGASGYLTKESAPEELITAIRKISEGKKYISPFLTDKMATEIGVDYDKPLHESLSDREYEVMCLIASGKTPKTISEKLSLSIKTISTYRSRILEKMRMKTNAELTNYAFKNNLIE